MGDSAALVVKMSQHEMLVRINSVYEAVMFSAVIILSVLLFENTKSINSVLARSAMLLRTGEALLGYTGVVLTLAILLYDIKDTVYKILMVCISTGTILYFYHFYEERLIPAILSVWGILGFSLMLLASFFQILNLGAGAVLNTVAAALAISFELVIGIFLIVRGVKKREVT